MGQRRKGGREGRKEGGREGEMEDREKRKTKSFHISRIQVHTSRPHPLLIPLDPGHHYFKETCQHRGQAPSWQTEHHQTLGLGSLSYLLNVRMKKEFSCGEEHGIEGEVTPK